jgi:hypothetical protein
MSKITFKVFGFAYICWVSSSTGNIFEGIFLIVKTSMKINMKQGEEMTTMLEYEACV